MFTPTTLTVGVAAINLYKALTGVVGGASQTFPGLKESACCRLRLTSSPANTAGSFIYIGGSNISATNAGGVLAVGGMILDETGVMNNIGLGDRWVLGSAAGLLLFVGMDFA